MQIDRRWALRRIGAVLAAGAGRQAFAQNPYPARPIRIIAPSSAGGPYDLIPRLVADYISRKYGWAIAVENRPGASGILGVVAAKQARPDGYTLVVPSAATHGSEPAFNRTLPYDPYTDLAPIILLAKGALVLLVGRAMRVNSVADLIALIRSKPGQLSFGSSGASTPHQLFMEMFLKMIGGRAQHVPYRGSVPALTDVVSGEIQMMMVDLAVAIPMINAGKVRVFGVTSPTRVKAMPDIPTIAEAGLPGFAATGWFSVVARAGTPRPIVDKIDRVLMAYLKRPEVAERLAGFAIDPLTSTPDELARFIPAEIVKWAQVVKDAGITPE